MKIISIIGLLTTALLLILSTPSMAAEAVIKSNNLYIFNGDDEKLHGCITAMPIASSGKNCQSTNQVLFKDGDARIKMASDEDLNLYILDNNQVLFKYTVGKLDQLPTDTTKALTDFFSKLQPLVTTSPTVSGKASAEAYMLNLDNLNIFDLTNAVGDLKQDDTVELKSAADLLFNGKVDEAEKKANDKGKILQTLSKYLSKAYDVKSNLLFASPMKFSAFGGSCRIIDGTVSNKSDINNLLTENCTSQNDLKDFTEELNKFYEILNNLDTLNTVVNSLTKFDKAILDSSKPFSLTPSSIEFSTKNIQTQHFSIEENNTFDDFVTDAAKTYRKKSLGEFSVTVIPEQNIIVSPAVGIIYSLVHNPTYSVTQDSSGKLRIDEKSKDLNATSGVVAINISSANFSGEYLKPHLQVGLVPDSDKFAFVLGIGAETVDNMALTVGAIYQKVNVLKDGLSVGQEVTSANDLQTSTDFKSGMYISINYSIK